MSQQQHVLGKAPHKDGITGSVAHLDEGGAGVLLGGVNGSAQGGQVGVAILHVLHVPAEGLKARGHILCEGDLRVAVDGDPAAGNTLSGITVQRPGE